MDQSDKKQFAQIMAGMADNFRDSITKAGMQMRFEMLNQYSIEQVSSAAKRIMARRKYTKMPPIAEFIDEMGDMVPKIEDKAITAADRVIASLSGFNSWDHSTVPDFSDDPITQYLMDKRWPYAKWATELLEAEIQWWKKEFVASYVAHESTGEYLRIEDNPDRKRVRLIGNNMLKDV